MIDEFQQKNPFVSLTLDTAWPVIITDCDADPIVFLMVSLHTTAGTSISHAHPQEERRDTHRKSAAIRLASSAMAATGPKLPGYYGTGTSTGCM